MPDITTKQQTQTAGTGLSSIYLKS